MKEFGEDFARENRTIQVWMLTGFASIPLILFFFILGVNPVFTFLFALINPVFTVVVILIFLIRFMTLPVVHQKNILKSQKRKLQKKIDSLRSVILNENIFRDRIRQSEKGANSRTESDYAEKLTKLEAMRGQAILNEKKEQKDVLLNMQHAFVLKELKKKKIEDVLRTDYLWPWWYRDWQKDAVITALQKKGVKTLKDLSKKKLTRIFPKQPETWQSNIFASIREKVKNWFIHRQEESRQRQKLLSVRLDAEKRIRRLQPEVVAPVVVECVREKYERQRNNIDAMKTNAHKEYDEMLDQIAKQAAERQTHYDDLLVNVKSDLPMLETDMTALNEELIGFRDITFPHYLDRLMQGAPQRILGKRIGVVVIVSFLATASCAFMVAGGLLSSRYIISTRLNYQKTLTQTTEFSPTTTPRPTVTRTATLIFDASPTIPISPNATVIDTRTPTPGGTKTPTHPATSIQSITSSPQR